MEIPTIVNEEPVIEAPQPAEVVIEAAPLPGEKTESTLLLESLQEERRKRRELESELARLQTPPSETFSEEGQALKRELDSLKEGLQLKELSEKYPALKDKGQEFNDFRSNPENKGMSVATAAKAFLAERDLLAPPAPRKGLEDATGGTRAPARTGRTEEEVADLRKNNYRKYLKEMKAGTLWN